MVSEAKETPFSLAPLRRATVKATLGKEDEVEASVAGAVAG